MIVNEQLNKILFNISQLITGLNINYKDVNEIKILVEKYRLIFIEIAEDIKLNIAEDITEVKPPLKSECSEDIQQQTFNFKENYDSDDDHMERNNECDIDDEKINLPQDPVKIGIAKSETKQDTIPEKKENLKQICDMCHKIVEDSTHVEQHIENGQYVCYYCDYHASAKEDLVTHYQQIHHPKFDCLYCVAEFTTTHELRVHLEEVHDIARTNQCFLCEQILHDKKAVDYHLQAKHNINKVPILCKICGKTFKTFLDLDNHRRNHEQPLLHTCEVCGIVRTSQQSIKRHILLVHSNEDPKFKCEQCEKLFHTNYDLKRHSKSHARNFLCTVCSYVASEKHHLLRHMESHIEGKEYSCDMCTKKFKSMQNLKKHKYMVHTHSHVKNWKCNYCDKVFKTSGNRNIHEKLHTKEYVAYCDICDKSFLKKYNYEVHIAKKHKNV